MSTFADVAPIAALEAYAARVGAGLMADTIDPVGIPNRWSHAVLAYRDGPRAWPEEQIKRFSKVVCISVTGDPAMAQHARELDDELYDATPQAAPVWVDARTAAGHQDATLYTDRDNLVKMWPYLGGRRPRLHIATLDNYPWTPHQLAAEIQATYGLALDPAWIWAIQCFAAGQRVAWADISLVWGKRDYWNPQSSSPNDGGTDVAAAG